MTAADFEARLTAWMELCKVCSGKGRTQRPTSTGRGACLECGGVDGIQDGSGQVPMLLGVTVERCSNLVRTEEYDSRIPYGFTHEKSCQFCGGSGYVWQRQDAVEKLLGWMGSTTTFARSANGWQVLWERTRRLRATWDTTLYEALLKAVDAVREIKSKSRAV